MEMFGCVRLCDGFRNQTYGHATLSALPFDVLDAIRLFRTPNLRIYSGSMFVQE